MSDRATQPNNAGRKRILLLCDDDPGHASTVLDHIAALRGYSRHEVVTLNPRPFRSARGVDLEGFDAVVIHYSICILVDNYLPACFRKALSEYRGAKIQFIQDDYRWVDRMARSIADLGIDVLFTLYPEELIPQVWGRYPELAGVTVHETLAGFVPREFPADPPPLRERPLDVVYRGREVPYWLGAFAQEKAWIGERFLQRAQGTGLRCDIAWDEGSRIYGDAWVRLMGSARASLGTGSGTSITDFDGEAERCVKAYLAAHPGASFAKVQAAVLAPFEGNIDFNVASPRIFEAIAGRTALVLFPGPYSGIVEPGKHYLPLERDFSNFDEVVARIRDVSFLEDLTGRAYSDVIASGAYDYRTFAAGVDDVIDEQLERRRTAPAVRHGSPIRQRAWFAGLERAWRGYDLLVKGSWGLVRKPLMILLHLLLVARDPGTRRFAVRWIQGSGPRPPLRSMLGELGRVADLRRLCRAEGGRPGLLIGPDQVTLTLPEDAIGRGDPIRDSGDLEAALSAGRIRRIHWRAPPSFGRRAWVLRELEFRFDGLSELASVFPHELRELICGEVGTDPDLATVGSGPAGSNAFEP